MQIQNRIKKVVAVHDLSCVGHVSLMNVIPILSSMGCQPVPLPTAVLSNHTQYAEFTFCDLTDEMVHIVDSWRRQHFTFDAFYTGYLGSPRQVGVVEDLLRDFGQQSALTVVDPVLGDNGSLYKGMSDEMVEAMRKLITKADVITPNLTEMYLLLGLHPVAKALDDEQLKVCLRELAARGPAVVIVTSVPVQENQHLTSVYAYDRCADKFWKVTCPFLPAHYPGTGDTFTSVITGSLLQGDSLPVALDRATQFILQGIRATFGYNYNNMDGMMLEKVLQNLNTPIQVSSFELL